MKLANKKKLKFLLLLRFDSVSVFFILLYVDL